VCHSVALSCIRLNQTASSCSRLIIMMKTNSNSI
jgi:hypothetical protein